MQRLRLKEAEEMEKKQSGQECKLDEKKKKSKPSLNQEKIGEKHNPIKVKLQKHKAALPWVLRQSERKAAVQISQVFWNGHREAEPC